MSPPRIKLIKPLGKLPKPSGYPDELDGGRQIANHIATLAPDYVDEEFASEYFHRCVARLAWVAIEGIAPGSEDHNIPNKRREARYAKLPLETMPPIVVQDGQIEDGHHRYRVAKAQGASGMWCYVVEDGD